MSTHVPGVPVFVYGTLRPPRDGTRPADSCFYRNIARYVRCAVPAWLEGGDLHDLGAFPGATPGAGTIQGDLLTVEPLALDVMDWIEGHPAYFFRERVGVCTAAGEEEAWIYWATAELVEGKGRIEGGDWFRRRDSEPGR